MFGTTAATSYTFNSDTSITATTPAAAAAGTVDTTVTTSCGTSATSPADQYTYTAATATAAATTTVTTAAQVPVASFSATPASGTAPLTVQFTDASSNSPTQWSWTFGDGGTSTSQNPSYTYDTPGVYSVSLTASNSAGSSAVDTQTGYITVSSAATTIPVPIFSASPTSGAAPLEVTFTDQSTGSPASWSWAFGDGGTSSIQDPSYTYENNGTYSVTLTETNSLGTNATTVTGYIVVGAVAPVASYTESSTSGTAPFTVQFTDTSTNAPISWTWDFGDGTTGTVENPSHTYMNSGSFVVTLTAANAAGTSTSVQQDTITVSAPVAAATFAPVVPVATATPQPMLPVVSFVGTPISGAAPLVVQFTATAPGSPESFAWDFGDGGTSTSQNPSYTYTIPGTYTVTLTVNYAAAGSVPTVMTSYITVGEPSTPSPLSPDLPLIALGISGMVSVMITGRRRRGKPE
jgi:PKD repeat protein